MTDPNRQELAQIEQRYARRTGKEALYNPLLPVNIAFRQERERVIASMVRELLQHRAMSSLKILEVGCGSGRNLVDFINFGADPKKCVGNELLGPRVEAALNSVPPGVTILGGDASTLDFPNGHFDIILQSTVFSSILDEGLRTAVANNMWRMLANGGAVLWYDFTVNNPNNPDVVGISRPKIRRLFREARCTFRRVTLAPPIARRAVSLHPALYPVLNMLPFLRTHLVAMLQK